MDEVRGWLFHRLMLVAGLVESDFTTYLLERKPEWEEGLDCERINERARSAGLLGPGEWIIERGEDASSDPGTPRPTTWLKFHHPDRHIEPIRIVVRDSAGWRGNVTKGHADRIAASLRAWAQRCKGPDTDSRSKLENTPASSFLGSWLSNVRAGGDWDMPGWPGGGWESLHPDLMLAAKTLLDLVESSSAAERLHAGLGLIELVWTEFPEARDAAPKDLQPDVADFLLAVWIRAGHALDSAEELAERHHVDSTPLRQHWMKNTSESVAALNSFVERLLVLERLEDNSGNPARDETNAEEPRCTHADDFTWVVWYGTRYTFSKGNQAESVRVLWEHWERSGRQNGCGCSEKTVGEAVGTSNENFRLAPVFAKHPAWGQMIRPMERRACFALFAPE